MLSAAPGSRHPKLTGSEQIPGLAPKGSTHLTERANRHVWLAL
jgi:hypothetical protein